jgi:hypothetical protein
MTINITDKGDNVTGKSWKIQSGEWENNPIKAFRAFLRGAANGPGNIPKKLLEALKEKEEFSVDAFVELVNEHERRQTSCRTPRQLKHPRKKLASVEIQGSPENPNFVWNCETRDKHEPDATDTTCSHSSITLFTNPFMIEVIGTNEDSVRARAGAVLDFPVATAVQRIIGRKRRM